MSGRFGLTQARPLSDGARFRFGSSSVLGDFRKRTSRSELSQSFGAATLKTYCSLGLTAKLWFHFCTNCKTILLVRCKIRTKIRDELQSLGSNHPPDLTFRNTCSRIAVPCRALVVRRAGHCQRVDPAIKVFRADVAQRQGRFAQGGSFVVRLVCDGGGPVVTDVRREGGHQHQ
jgi:hypothetical protein